MNGQTIRDFVAEDGYGLSCSHCGHVSTEDDPVVNKTAYVGGKGYIVVLQCADEQACWQRWDEQNGFGKCPKCGTLLIDDNPVGPHCLVCGKIEYPGNVPCIRETASHYEARPESLMVLAASW